jgi:hypothetical protein
VLCLPPNPNDPKIPNPKSCSGFSLASIASAGNQPLVKIARVSRVGTNYVYASILCESDEFSLGLAFNFLRVASLIRSAGGVVMLGLAGSLRRSR